jgi:hypothetical protein
VYESSNTTRCCFACLINVILGSRRWLMGTWWSVVHRSCCVCPVPADRDSCWYEWHISCRSCQQPTLYHLDTVGSLSGLNRPEHWLCVKYYRSVKNKRLNSFVPRVKLGLPHLRIIISSLNHYNRHTKRLLW